MPEEPGRPHIAVDRELCIGSGVCIAYAHHTFGHDGETKAVVIDPKGDPVGDIRSAVEGCPTAALTLNEQEGG